MGGPFSRWWERSSRGVFGDLVYMNELDMDRAGVEMG